MMEVVGWVAVGFFVLMVVCLASVMVASTIKSIKGHKARIRSVK